MSNTRDGIKAPCWDQKINLGNVFTHIAPSGAGALKQK